MALPFAFQCHCRGSAYADCDLWWNCGPAYNNYCTEVMYTWVIYKYFVIYWHTWTIHILTCIHMRMHRRKTFSPTNWLIFSMLLNIFLKAQISITALKHGHLNFIWNNPYIFSVGINLLFYLRYSLNVCHVTVHKKKYRITSDSQNTTTVNTQKC